MDENKPRRRWLSFGIRDLLWAMLVVAVAVGWWSHSQRAASLAKAELDQFVEKYFDLLHDYKKVKAALAECESDGD